MRSSHRSAPSRRASAIAAMASSELAVRTTAQIMAAILPPEGDFGFRISDCGSPLSPSARCRFLAAAGLLPVLAVLLRSPAAELPRRLPALLGIQPRVVAIG